MSKFERLAGRFLRWPSLAGLVAVSVASAVGLGGQSKAKQEERTDPNLYTVPYDGETNRRVIPENPVEYSMRERQVTDRMVFSAKNTESCAPEAVKEANFQLKSKMWDPSLGSLWLICASRDKKTQMLKTDNVTCDLTAKGPDCVDADKLVI